MMGLGSRVDSGVDGIGDDQGELGTDMPALLTLAISDVIEVDGDHVIWLAIRVAKGEEQDSPEKWVIEQGSPIDSISI